MGLVERISTNREAQFWILQFAGWTGWVVLFSIRDAYWGQPMERIALLLVDAAAGMLLTTGLRYVYQAVWNRAVVIRVFTVLSVSYMAAAIWQPVKNYSQFYYYDEFELVAEYGMMGYFQGMIGYSYFLMLCWSGLYFALKFYQLLQSEQQRSIRAESLAHESQLRMLRYQLNPHFLFNTLNAISTLILSRDTETANSMVSKLSNFLRYSLDKDPMQKVDLEHEISTMKLYLDIEKVRFDERLQVEIDVEPGAESALVPSLLLQPLVENAIKYAIASSESGGRISITGRICEGALCLKVGDDGPGMLLTSDGKPDVRGVGLTNIENRLSELYGDDHSISYNPVSPQGLDIEIRIPLEVD